MVIIGAGGFGREVKTIIDAVNKVEKTYNFIGYYDDGIEKGTIFNNFPVLGNLQDLNATDKEISVLLGVGDPTTKGKIVNTLSNEKINFYDFASFFKEKLKCANALYLDGANI